MFEIENLTFKHILHMDHLCIDRQITCITGPSGSGKTTFLRMLNRLNDPDDGRILWNGNDIAQMDATKLRRKVLMLKQTPVVYTGTIEDNLQIGLQFSKRPLAKQEKLKEYLKKVQLDKQLNDSVAKLSGGEKQRLCLARIMLMDADVYLLDEPSSALDKETENFVIENMVQFVKENNKMLIMVTHSPAIAELYPESILEIKDGNCEGYAYE